MYGQRVDEHNLMQTEQNEDMGQQLEQGTETSSDHKHRQRHKKISTHPVTMGPPKSAMDWTEIWKD